MRVLLKFFVAQSSFCLRLSPSYIIIRYLYILQALFLVSKIIFMFVFNLPFFFLFQFFGCYSFIIIVAPIYGSIFHSKFFFPSGFVQYSFANFNFFFLCCFINNILMAKIIKKKKNYSIFFDLCSVASKNKTNKKKRKKNYFF